MTDLNQTLENLRGNYQGTPLDVGDCQADPSKQFDFWMDNAIKSQCDEPNAFVLSTVSADCKPRARVVLLKGINDGKFVFYTNYQSSKGEEMAINSRVAITFLWLPLQRQVRVEGIVTKVDPISSEEYFQKRPRGSQIGAIASPQSKRVNSREELEKLFKEATNLFAKTEKLPRPSHWGGYSVTPDYYEFWQGRPNRMHDRICFERANEGWKLFRLAP